jgi:hypothetical protein
LVLNFADPEQLVDWVPRLPKGMCLRDFPRFVICTADPEDDAMLAMLLRSMECHRTVPSTVMFHTFDELERQAISTMTDILPPIYAVGPLPLFLGQAGAGTSSDHGVIISTAAAGSSLSKEDRACLDWLDGKRSKSVVFVSFGSLVNLIGEQLVELAWGLADNGYEFLWVIRSDQQTSVVLPPEFLVEMEGRGRVTS